MVNPSLYIGLQCVACGAYCRLCDQNSGSCKKCKEGFMMMNQTCSACSGGICSCSALESNQIVYVDETALKI